MKLKSNELYNLICEYVREVAIEDHFDGSEETVEAAIPLVTSSVVEQYLNTDPNIREVSTLVTLTKVQIDNFLLHLKIERGKDG